ncbi:DNA-3-methyladenine glycosylase I [Lactobacillus sp.]|uniref:DNA-3-methyladenine glycosylase I n=1 Tax=Lactobacillus sp. TaxID=1591 RepID=UPI003EF381E6
MGACAWFKENNFRQAYHEEWGTPCHDDQKLFEFLVLEVMQCGLSFSLMLDRREAMRAALDQYDYRKIAKYGQADFDRVMAADGMIHSSRKILALITDAQAYEKVIADFGSFDQYLWQYTDGQSLVYESHLKDVPTTNELAQRLSKDLKKRGFKFVGPVVMYSYLQACGLINDHDEACPRRQYLMDHYPTRLLK